MRVRRTPLLLLAGFALIAAAAWRGTGGGDAVLGPSGPERDARGAASARRETETAAREREAVDEVAEAGGAELVGVVAGRVVDEDGGAVEGAVVVALPADADRIPELADDAAAGGNGVVGARSGADGRFELHLGAGVVLARVSASRRDSAPAPAIEVRVGRRDVELVLRDGIVLRGRVDDVAGAPVAGAALVYRAIVNGCVVERRAASDDGGRYEMPGIPVTNARGDGIEAEQLVVTAAGFAPRSVSEPVGAMRDMVYEGAMDLDVMMSRGGVVRGRVTDAATGATVGGARVELWSCEGLAFHDSPSTGRTVRAPFERRLDTVATRPDGTFELRRVPAGYDGFLVSDGSAAAPIVMRVMHAGHAVAGVAVSLHREGDELDVEIPLHRCGGVRGRVVDGDGTPVRGAYVVLRFDDWSDVGIDPTHEYAGTPPPEVDRVGWRAGAAGRFWMLTGADGRFEHPRLPCRLDRPTKVELSVEGPDVSYMNTTAELEVGATFDFGDLVVDVDEVTELRCRVVDEDGEAVAGAEVWADEQRHLADTAGRCLLPVHGPLEEVETEVVVKAVGFAMLLTSTPAAPPEGVLEFVLAPESRLSGVVVDAAGSPVSDGLVAVSPVDGDDSSESWQLSTLTGPDGRFEVGGLPLPPWTVEARAPHDASDVTVTVAEAADDLVLALDHTLPASGGLELRITDETGSAPVLPVQASMNGGAGRFLSGHRRGPGTFEWRDVPAGAYRLRVTAFDRAAALRDVRVVAGAKQTVVVHLEHGVDVTVRSLWGPRVPESAVWSVRAVGPEGESIDGKHSVGPGELVFRNLMPGRWSFITLCNESTCAPRMTVELSPATTSAAVDVPLALGASLKFDLPVPLRDDRSPWHELERYRLVITVDGERVLDDGVSEHVVRFDGESFEVRTVVPPGRATVELFRGSGRVWRRDLDVVAGERYGLRSR